MPTFLKIMLLIGSFTIGFVETITEIIILHNFTLQMQEFCGVVLIVNALARNCR